MQGVTDNLTVSGEGVWGERLAIEKRSFG